jgi:hypothetical protein
MAKITSEYTFEEHVEEVLLKQHGYFPAQQEDYDKALCMRPETVMVTCARPVRFAHRPGSERAPGRYHSVSTADAPVPGKPCVVHSVDTPSG